MERDKAGVGDRMITVKCGFSECDWEEHGDDLAFNSEHKLMGDSSLFSDCSLNPLIS